METKLVKNNFETLMHCFKELQVHNDYLWAKGFDFKKWKQYNEQTCNMNEMPCKVNDLTQYMLSIFLSNRYRKASSFKVADLDFKNNLYNKIVKAVAKEATLDIILPSFPFKSGGFAKCSRKLPDLAEVASLCRLWEIIQKASLNYRPGLRIIILSDGSILSGIFNINKRFTKEYLAMMRRLTKVMGIENNLKIINLEDILQKNIPNLETAIEKEKNTLKESLKPQDLYGLYSSLRLNYDNKLWSQNLIISLLKNTSLERIRYQLQAYDKNIIDRVFDYKAVWSVIEKSQILEKVFPDHIRATPHTFKHDNKIAFHMIEEKTIILPWMGVGVIRNQQQKNIITVKYEYQMDKKNYLPIFLDKEETPFAYMQTNKIN